MVIGVEKLYTIVHEELTEYRMIIFEIIINYHEKYPLGFIAKGFS